MSDDPYGLELPEEDPTVEWAEEQVTPVIPSKTMEELMQNFRPTRPMRPEVLRRVLGESKREER